MRAGRSYYTQWRIPLNRRLTVVLVRHETLRWIPSEERPGEVAVIDHVTEDNVVHFHRKGSGGFEAYDWMVFDAFAKRVKGIKPYVFPQTSIYAEAVRLAERARLIAASRCGCEGDYCTNPTCDWPD